MLFYTTAGRHIGLPAVVVAIGSPINALANRRRQAKCGCKITGPAVPE